MMAPVECGRLLRSGKEFIKMSRTLALVVAVATLAALTGVSSAAATVDACYGVSWEVNGAQVSQATMRPVTDFPLAHPAATSPAVKACMGYGASAQAQQLPIPASGKIYNARTGTCAATAVTGGELLLNHDGVKAASGLGKARRSRLMIAQDVDGSAYVLVLHGALGAASGGRIGVAVSGRDLADSGSLPSNAGDAALLHPSAGVRDQVSACSLSSTVTEDCLAFDTLVGQAALRFSWESCCPEGAVIGKLPATGACVSLAYTFTDGVDAVEVGSYSNATGSIQWTEVPAAAAAAGIRVCGRSCADHCTNHRSCGACGGDSQCAWCPSSNACLSAGAAAAGSCADTVDHIGECLETCATARTCATCAQRPSCGWCHATESCHGADAAGAALAGAASCPASAFATAAATCGADATCPGALTSLGVPAAVGFEKVAKACNGRGTCDEETNRCSCGVGWAGADCNTRCVGGSVDSPCSNRGACDKRDGSCFCKPGFRGVACNDPTGETVGTCSCGVAGTVRLPSGATMEVCTGRAEEDGVCTCREGWVGPDCEEFCPGAGPPALTADPASPEAKLCGGRGTCPPTPGSTSATCACDPGYVPLGVGGVCVPMTCAAGTCPTTRGRCTFNAVTNLMECTCKGGYTGQGCNACSCLNGGTCNSVTAECECPPGFAGDRCETSIPATAARAAHCGANGVYNVALRRCACNHGYVGERCGVACSSSTTCSGHGICDATGACACAEGFQGAACDSCAAGYADYPFCSPTYPTGCVSAVDGSGYLGTQSRTLSGRTCQRWDAQSPVPHSFTPTAPGMAAHGIGAHNYCRNPTGDPLPWCFVDYTADTSARARDQSTWQYCPAPLCRDDSAEAAPAQCSLIGSVTIAPWAGSKTQQIPAARGSDAGCASAAESAYAGNDLTLHDDVQIRTAFSTSSALPYVTAIGMEAATTAAGQRRSILVAANMTLVVAGALTGLPFAAANDAEPTITAFKTTAFSRTGVENYGATMTWISGLVIDLVSVTCDACADGHRLEMNVKVNAADGVVSNNTLCGGASGSAVKVTCNSGTTPFGSCAAVPNTTDLVAACSTGRAAYTPPASIDDQGLAACLQCSHMGVEGNCLAQLATLGVDVVGPIADVCRARFRNIYGAERATVLDVSLPLWGSGEGTSGGTTGSIPDSVSSYSTYPDMSAFERSAASAVTITESEYSLDMVKFIVGTTVTRGPESKTRGIPYAIDGTTAGRAKWPFPSIEDECRGAADVASGGGGFVLRKLLHQVSYDQLLRVRTCDTQYPAEVAIYEKDYVDVTDAAVDANNQITLSFTPWRNDTRYEVRLEYSMTGTAESTYAATVGGTLLGNWIVYPPTLTTGHQGFETQLLSATGAAATVTLTPALGSAAPALVLIGATVRAANANQVAKQYKPYAGYAQTTCGLFQTTRCGSLTFTAKANSEYFIAVTGRGVAEGAFSFQLEKVHAKITMLKTVSDNAAASAVSTNDGNGVRQLTGKLAKVGDTLTVTVRSGRVIDKPTIRVNGVAVPTGLVIGTGSNWEATFVVRAVYGFADGPLTVTARPPATPSDPSRGFAPTVTPQGADKALVVFDATPPTMANALIVNVDYLTPLNVNAPDECQNSDDVKVSKAKNANVGDVVVLVFHASEPVVGVRAVIGGLSAAVLMDAAGPAPIEVKRARDAWRVTLEDLRTASSPVITDETFGVAYVTLTADVVQQGNLAFTVEYTDAAGNAGVPLTAIAGAPAGASAASSLVDRLRADPVLFDSFLPTRSGDVALSHVDGDVTAANAPAVAGAFHAVQQVATGSLAYRLGDTVIADVAWNKPVTRPYGAYLRAASNDKQHVKQADVNIRNLARFTAGGSAQCRQTEFRPRAQEAVSRQAGWGGKTSFALNPLSSVWRVTGRLEDPCDLVGRGALAWSLRNDCRAEDRGDGSFWIPMWARWCREGWGLLGYSLPEVYDGAGNRAVDFSQAPVTVNNARARDVVPARTAVGEVIVRSPVVLSGKLAPSVAVAGQKQAQNVAPSVVELYAEPSSFIWNMYRRVVLQGTQVQFHFYFDQPVKQYRMWIGGTLQSGPVRHANIAPAYKVHKPCSNGANLNDWLKGQQLVALSETINNPGTFDSDDDFLDATVNGRWDSTVQGTSPDPVPCFGFWVLRGNGNFDVKRLCARRQGLLNAAGVTVDAACSDTEDRVYVTTRGHTYLSARVTLTADMMAQPDGPMAVRWQLMGDNNVWGAETQSTGFFNRAQANSNDVATVTARVGPGFNPRDACNRNAVSNYDQPGSSVWVAVDKTPPTLVTAAAEVNVAQADPVALIAARGDTVTVTATYDEQLDPSNAPLFHTADGRRVTPTKVYYQTATYELVVGTTIPATDGPLRLTFGPVDDVVGNRQAAGVTRDVFADGKTVTIQSAPSKSSVTTMLGTGYTYSCVTSSGNPLSDVVSGPDHVFSVVLDSSTSLSVASATVAGAAAGVTTTLSVTPGGSVADSRLTVTRTVTAAGFVDGATINWNLLLRTSTTCLSGSGTCPVKFEVNRCPAAGAVAVVGGVATVTAWTPPVVADFTPPTIDSLSMVPGAAVALGAVVRPTQIARIKAVASEPMVNGANTSEPVALLKTKECAATQLTDATLATLTAGSTSTYEFLMALRNLTAMADCSTSLVCVTFSAATDLAGNALANPTLCAGFGSLLTSSQPGWLFFDNMPVTPTSFTAEKVGTSCADSSVSAASCTVAAASAPLAHGSWIKAVVATATPTAVEKILVGGRARSGGLPTAGDHYTLVGCGNIAPTAECEAFAASRGGCETFLCPTCAFRHTCDESCGYCQTGRGAATLQTMYVRTSDFPSLAAGTLSVQANLRTAGKVSAQVSASGGGLPYAAAGAASCAGRCGGAAPSGCSCDPSCFAAGACCADAGLCCDPETPNVDATEPAGGCLLPPAVPLIASVTWWSERSDGALGSVASPGSTVYLRVAATKPIEVLSATLGGVSFEQNNIAVEYQSGAVALERSSVAAGRAAFGAGDNGGFVAAETNFLAARADLPAANLPYEFDAHTREYPSIPNTRNSTMRMGGQRLVPQPSGPLSYSIRVAERSHSPFYTAGAITTMTGFGPTWSNIPVVVEMSAAKVTSRRMAHHRRTRRHLLNVPGGASASVVAIGDTVAVEVVTNTPVVVTSFIFETYPLSCRGSMYGGSLHGQCEIDPFIVLADPSNLADYRTDWSGKRTFDERERLVLASNPIRVSIAVVDAAGNKGSTSQDLPSPFFDNDAPVFLADPTVVGVTPTSIDVLVEMSEPGTVGWLPLYECQTGQVPTDCVTKTGANVTGSGGAEAAPAPVVITIPVPPDWLDAPGNGVVQIKWWLCDSAGNCGPADPAETDVVLPGGASPTVTPNLELVDPDAATVNLTVGGGGTAACWAVLRMATATTTAEAPTRTAEETCAPASPTFTSPLWGNVTGLPANGSADVNLSPLDPATPYCLYTTPSPPGTGDASALCFSTADNTPPSILTVQGLSSGCSAGTKTVGPNCELVVLVIADEPITAPVLTLTYAPTGEADMAALDPADRPSTTIRSAAASGTDPSTRWTVTFGTPMAKYLPYGNLSLNVTGCFDLAPFGNGAGVGPASNQAPNECPSVPNPGYKGSDIVPVFVDNRAPAPTKATTARDPTPNVPCMLGDGDAVVITMTFDEATSRPTFTCMGNPVAASDVTIPGATAATTSRFSLTWAARCVIRPGVGAGSALTYTVANLADKWGNAQPAATTYTQANVGAVAPNCTVKSLMPVLVNATFDVPVVRPTQTVTMTVTASEKIKVPSVTVGTVTPPAADMVPAALDAATNTSLTWTVAVVLPADTIDGPLNMAVGPIEDAYGNVNARLYVRPIGAGSSRPLVDSKQPRLRLIDFTSDNVLDPKVAIPGDVVRLVFEADELVTAPVVTVGGATAAVEALPRVGVVARGFTTPTRDTVESAWTATVNITAASTPTSGPIPWTASGFADIAGNVGASGQCVDWLPGCAAVAAAQTPAQRDAEPEIVNGLPVTTFDAANFVELSPFTTVWTLFPGLVDVRASARVDAAATAQLAGALASFDADVGMWYYAQHISTAHLLWQHGGACGAASNANCRTTCGTCNDGPVISKVGEDNDAVDENVTVDGLQCKPVVRDGDLVTWNIGVKDGRPISKPSVRFRDAVGGLFTVPPANVTPAVPGSTVAKPTPPGNPCVGVVLDARVGDGVCDAALNFPPCWDGGDCCEDTCSVSSTCGTNGYDCLDRRRNPITGLDAPGAWATYNTAVAVAVDLAPAWSVSFTVDAAGLGGIPDGVIAGEVCCMRDEANSDPLGAGGVGWVPGASSGNECLGAVLNNNPGEVLEARFITGNGMDVVISGVDVTLELVIGGVPSTPAVEIAGVGALSVTRVPNAAGDASDPTAVNSTWRAFRPTLNDVDPDIARLIDLEEASGDPGDDDGTVNTTSAADLNPCDVGVVVLWAANFTDVAGFTVTTRTAHFVANTVCYDYKNPDVVRIVQETSGNPGYAKVGDVVTLEVLLNRAIDLPTRSTLAGEPCVPTRTGNASLSCPLTVTPATEEGPVELVVEGMVATDGMKLPTVNFTYTNLWPTVLPMDGDPTNTDPENAVPNLPVIVDVTPPTILKLAAEVETGVEPKQCALCCRMRIDVELSEDTTEPTFTVAGTLVASADDITGSGSVWSATVVVCDENIPAGPLAVEVFAEDLAGNPVTSSELTGPDDADAVPVDFIPDGNAPLRAVLYSNRPGYPGLGKEDDVLTLALDMSGVVSITQAVIGPADSAAGLVTWTVFNGTVDANGRAKRWRAFATVLPSWGDIDPVPWSITYNTGTESVTVTGVVGLLPADPASVRVDVTPPTAIFVNVTSNGPLDPIASNPDAVTIVFTTSEPVQTPNVTITGSNLPPGSITGGGDRWFAGPRVVIPEDLTFADPNGCVTFSITLTDLAGHTAAPIVAMVGAPGTPKCPTTRVELDLAPPVFLWLQTNTITSTAMTFDVALNEPATVYFVAVPQGSAEPTPDEVTAGTGSGGASASSLGEIDYVGSTTPSPAAAGGGIGQVTITVPGLLPGLFYDIYFTAEDRFGQSESRARSRRLASLGVATPAASLSVEEGGDDDVIVLQLTQPPTADVTVTLAASTVGTDGQLLFAEEANTLVFTNTLSVTFIAATWEVPVEVKVKAADDNVVEGDHTVLVALSVASADARYAGLAVTPLRCAVKDNDVAAVIISDPREAPQMRQMVCDGSAPPSVLSYTTDEATPVDANVWLAGAPPGADEVVVELTTSDANWLILTPTNAAQTTVLRFTQGNFDTQVPIRIVPVNSDVADADRQVDILTTVSSVSAPYSNISVPDIPVTIVDLQTPGILFSRTQIRAPAGIERITMRLQSEPRANVVVDFAIVQDPDGAYNYADVTISPTQITFVPDDFGTAVPVDFILADDGTAYGDVQIQVIATFTSQGDIEYANLVPTPITITVLEGDPDPAWIVADITGVTRIVAAPGTPPLPPPTIAERTGVLRYSVRPSGNLWKTVTIAPTFAPGTTQKGIITPETFTYVPGAASVAQFTLTFPSNDAVLGDQDITIWHVVTGVDDEPGYRLLNPNFGGGELTVTLIDGDKAGFNLGNGASGSILVEEPQTAAATPVTTSMGIVLGSKPLGTVQLQLYEAVNATNVVNYNATRRRRSLLQTAVTGSDQQLTIVSGQTLTFTEADWFLPHSVSMYANYVPGDQGRRRASLCTTVVSPDDTVYANFPAPCYYITVSEYNDEAGPTVINGNTSVVIEVDEIPAANITGPGPLFQRFTKYWRIRAFLLPMRLELAYVEDYVNISFRVNSSYYTDQSAVNVMLNPDTTAFTTGWIPVDRAVFGLEFVNGTDEVKGYTTMMGTYFLGQAWPGLAVNNPTEAELFKEKGLPSGLLSGLNIAPADLSGDNPISVVGARVNLQGFFDVEFDSLNLTGCANITVGCIIGNIYAVYFDILGELTLRPASEAPPEFPASVRRRLLQVTADPTTDEYAAVLDTTEFEDTNVNPDGSPRLATVTVIDNFGGTATGPQVTMPTAPTNDPPIVNVGVLSLNYVEKELTALDTNTVPSDVDSLYLTRAEILLEPAYEIGDSMVWDIDARKAQYAANTPTPLAIPAGLDNLTVTITSSSVTPTTPNAVTIDGIAPFAAYKMALDSVKFQNNGPLISNVLRKITYRIYDDQNLGNVVPPVYNTETAGFAVRFMNLINVNDPPVADARQTVLILSRPGATGIGQLLATDLDSPQIWFNITCFPGKGTVTLDNVNTGEYTYVSDPDKPGTDTFVFFAWDGELSSRFATVTVRTGSGVAAPVATDLTIEVWENSPTTGIMPATDFDGPADIYRYQIAVEPNSPGSLVLDNEVSSLFRYSNVSGFVYTAATSSVVVQRVATAMGNLPQDFNFNDAAGTARHPGYQADSFTFRVIDLAGRVSNPATVNINVRLTLERNNPPISTALGGAAFTTVENTPLTGPDVKYQSADIESPNNLNHTILVTDPDVTPSFSGPRIGVITRVSADLNDPRFTYTPYPFYHGVDNLKYYATDAHGARSEPVDLQITVQEVNDAPVGACAPASPMDIDVKLAMGQGTTQVIAAGSGASLKDLVQTKVDADVGTLRAQFVSYSSVLQELDLMTNISGAEKIALACGDPITTVRLVHTARTAFVMLAFDVDNFAPGSVRYVVKQLPSLTSDGSVAGDVYPWVAPNYTEIPSEDVGGNSTFEWQYLDADFPASRKLAAGASVNFGAVPALVFEPKAFVAGEVVFKWAAVDALGEEGPENDLTFKVQCPGGEKLAGTQCFPCAPGMYNDRALLDQTTCINCPAGTQTPNLGSTRCEACPANTYSAVEGTAVCLNCPDPDQRSIAGSNSVNGCQCRVGTIQLSLTGCWPCDLFRTKCDYLGQQIPMPYKGHWTDPSAPKRTLDCIPNVACVEKNSENEVKNRRCAHQRFEGLATPPAYVGDGCFTCEVEHYRHAGHCHHCGSDSQRKLRFGMLIVLYVIMVALLLEVACSPAVGAMGILITFLQISASFKYLSIFWPKALYAWLTAASVSFLDMELWGAECLYPEDWSYFAKFRLAMFQPMLWVVIVMLSVCVRVLRRVAVEYLRRASLALRLRVNARKRWLHKQVDPDALTWKKLADDRRGLPLDRPELVDKDDKLNATEELDMQLGDFDREQDYRELTARQDDEATPGFMRLVKKYFRETMNRAKPCSMLLFQWGYFLLAQQCMSFWDCKSDGEKTRLVSDPEVECYKGMHAVHMPLAIIAFVVYPAGMLVGSYLFIFAYRADGPRPRVNARMQVMMDGGDAKLLNLIDTFQLNFGLLYSDARPEWINWNLVDMGKKLAIVMIKVFVPYPISQTICCMALLMSVALLTAKAEPFRMKSLNYAEQIACNINVLVLILGYFFQLGIWAPATTDAVASFANAIIVLTILVLLFFVALDAYPWIRRFISIMTSKAQDSDEEIRLEYVNPSVSGPQGNTFFVIPPSNFVRRKCWNIIRSSLFDRYIMVVVMMTSVISIVDMVPLEPGPRARLTWLNDFFTVLFCAECGMKIIALGFVLGENAYLRDSFNCLDFLVVLLSILLWIASAGGPLGGIRSARFFKYLKFFKLKYIRVLRIGLRMRQMTGGHMAAVYRKAIEPDTPRVEAAMKKAHLLFDSNVCEQIHMNIRNLPKDVSDSAVDLIEEFYREGFDPESIVVVSQQLHAVRRSINKEHLQLIYDWLAFHAKHSEKTAFLETLVLSRDYMATLGHKRIQLEMAKIGPARHEVYEMTGDEALLSRDMANELRRRKNAGKGDVSEDGVSGSKKWSADDAEADDDDDEDGVRPPGAGPNGKKLRHGHGKDSTYRTQEELEQEMELEEVDGRGEEQVTAFSSKRR